MSSLNVLIEKLCRQIVGQTVPDGQTFTNRMNEIIEATEAGDGQSLFIQPDGPDGDVILLVYLKVAENRQFFMVHWNSEERDCLACPEAEMRQEDPENLHILKQMWQSVQKAPASTMH